MIAFLSDRSIVLALDGRWISFDEHGVELYYFPQQKGLKIFRGLELWTELSW